MDWLTVYRGHRYSRSDAGQRLADTTEATLVKYRSPRILGWSVRLQSLKAIWNMDVEI